MSIQTFHRCRVYQADHWDLICGLCSCTERFPFPFLSQTAPGAQLWFWPHLCMRATLRFLFATQVRERQKQWPIGSLSLIGALIRSGQGERRRPQLWHMQSACGRDQQEDATDWDVSGGSPSQCPWRQGPAGGEGFCNGDPAPCTPLNNDTSFPRQTMLPLAAFPAMEPLTPISSSCLCPANSSPLPRSTLLTPHFSTQLPPELAASCLRLGCPGLILD